jgi:competence protein ComEC
MATRFRAYKMNSKGASFSYSTGSTFTLIEARFPEEMHQSFTEELKECTVTGRIDKLHITSWDQDHCPKSELEIILEHLEPKIVEIPGYAPSTVNGQECKIIIENYNVAKNPVSTMTCKSPDYIAGLSSGSAWNTNDIIYGPEELDSSNNNNNSTIKLFRGGSFNVASLGDVESPEIAKSLMNRSIFSKEIDILILPHHGADNGFITPEFLKSVNPTVTISASNYANQHDHPKPSVQTMCIDQGCFFATTKRGDILVIERDINHFEVLDLYKDSERVWKDAIYMRKESLQ